MTRTTTTQDRTRTHHQDRAERAQVLAWTEAERQRVADLLESLADHEWRAASLCDGWTVRDVAAHLTLSTRTTPLVMLRGMVRSRGDVHRMIGDLARDRATAHTPSDLVAQIRQDAASTRRAPGTSVLDPLTDALVHAHDVARPLGREHVVPVEPVVAALDHVWGNRFFPAEHQAGLRLVATNADWSAGEGQVVRSPAMELLLLATGRPAAVERS